MTAARLRKSLTASLLSGAAILMAQWDVINMGGASPLFFWPEKTVDNAARNLYTVPMMNNDTDRTPTQGEAYNEMVRNVCADNPERCWVLTPYDTWERNPNYTGPEEPHPESGPEGCPECGRPECDGTCADDSRMYPGEEMDGDAASALASAGMGTDEDYEHNLCDEGGGDW